MSNLSHDIPEVFLLIGDVTFDKIAQLKRWIYRCAVEERELICILSGDAGMVDSVVDLKNTLEGLNVRFTTVGYGKIGSVVSAIYSLGDERVLMQDSELIITDFHPETIEFYKAKTLISETVWEEKVVNGIDSQWEVKKSELRKYELVTQSYSTIVKKIIKYYKEVEEAEHPYFLCEKFDSITAGTTIEYIYQCAANNQDVVMEICSEGGSFTALMAILDTIKVTKVNFIAIGGGLVGSSAAILFLTASIRALKSGTRFLMHKVFGNVNKESKFQQEEFAEFASKLKTMNTSLEKVWLPNTKISSEEYHKKVHSGKDWFIPQEDWKKYGIVTTEYDEIRNLIFESMKSE